MKKEKQHREREALKLCKTSADFETWLATASLQSLTVSRAVQMDLPV